MGAREAGRFQKQKTSKLMFSSPRIPYEDWWVLLKGLGYIRPHFPVPLLLSSKIFEWEL
jgi:hypothetical protein